MLKNQHAASCWKHLVSRVLLRQDREPPIKYFSRENLVTVTKNTQSAIPMSSFPAIYLTLPLQAGISDRTRESAGNVNLPYSILLRMGFAKHESHPSSGGLLPRLFTLTEKSAVFFLWRFP